MGRALLCCALGVASLTWAQETAEAAAPPVTSPPAVSAPVDVGAGPAAGRGDAVIVNTGLGPMAGPEAGVVWRHALGGRWAFTAGFYGVAVQLLSSNLTGPNGSLAGSAPGTMTAFTLEPGVRLYLGRTGLFAGADLPIGWSKMAAQGVTSGSVVAGLDLVGGFEHVFESGLTLEAYAGPAARAWRLTDDVSGGSLQSIVGTLALRAGVGVGYAF